MATFSIEVKEYDIITCTQVQSAIIFVRRTKVEIDKDGNGRIKLFASNTEAAMNAAGKLLASDRKG